MMRLPDDHTDARQTRREFCAHTCQFVALTALAPLVAGCAGSPTAPSRVASLPVVNGSLTNGSVTVTIDSTSPLSSVGGAALVQFGGGSVLAVRSGQDAFTALSSTCTHQTCTITGFGNQLFVCPCHGSEFDTSGQVVLGPAAASLRQYATSFAGHVLTITT